MAWTVTIQLFKAGVGKLFTIMGRINCGLLLAGRKKCILRFYFYLIMRDGGFLLHPNLSTCLSWSFVLTWFCTINWLTKILMRAISNVHAGRRFPTPGWKQPPRGTQLSIYCWWSFRVLCSRQWTFNTAQCNVNKYMHSLHPSSALHSLSYLSLVHDTVLLLRIIVCGCAINRSDAGVVQNTTLMCIVWLLRPRISTDLPFCKVRISKPSQQ